MEEQCSLPMCLPACMPYPPAMDRAQRKPYSHMYSYHIPEHAAQATHTSITCASTRAHPACAHLQGAAWAQHGDDVVQRHCADDHPGCPLRNPREDVCRDHAHPHKVALLEQQGDGHKQDPRRANHLCGRTHTHTHTCRGPEFLGLVQAGARTYLHTCIIGSKYVALVRWGS